MDTKQLEYILTIAHERNLMKAAEKCFITQPALSHFITKLEEELGYPLFFRERNNWTLTPVGEIFAEGARSILNTQEETRRRIDEYLARPTLQIRIGVGTDRASRLFHQAVPIFQEHFPQTKLSIYERRSLQLREMLKRGELDIIICAWNRTISPNEEILFSLPEPILLAARKGKKLPSYRKNADDAFPTVDLASLDGQPFIIHGTSTSIRPSVDHLIKKAGFTPTISLELESSAAIIRYAADDAGLAFLQYAYSNQYRDILDFYYTNPSMDMNFCIAHRKGTLIPKAAQTLIEIVKDLLK